ncbi:MAG: hypothetical protein ACXACG_18220 [Candidatus Thorarchaeota archaeon]
MSKKKTEHSPGEESIEWDSQRSSELGLTQTHMVMLDKLIPTIGARCKSVILCGSWAEGTSSVNSDLDILFIPEDENNKRTTITILKNILSSKANRLVYDCKVLSIDDINKLSKGNEHFAIWLMMSTGVVLQGSNLKGMLKLDMERVRVLINRLSDSINDCLATLESNIQFSGACVKAAYISRSLFFISRHLLKKHHHPELKTEYIRQLLGPIYDTVEQVYRNVVISRKSLGEFGVDQRIQARKDKGYSQKQYQELHNACVKLESTIHETRLQLKSMQVLP